MNIKQSIVIMAAMALSYNVQAQSLEEGVKMYQYERYESAGKALAPLAASNPNANYYLGLSQLQLGNVEEAKATFSKYPEDVANMAGMARVAFAQKNPNEGNRIVGVLTGKAGKKAWEPLKYAADAIANSEGGNIQQAIDLYKDALKRNDNTDTRLALGDAYLKMPSGSGGGEAANNYEKVMAKEPKNSLALYKHGALFYAARNYTLALESYKKSIEADPTNPLPYKDLAGAYYMTGKYDLAKQNIEKYLELSDKSTDDMITYANILYLAKDYEKAEKTIQDVINNGVKKPGLYGVLGFSQYELKKYDQSLENIRQYFATQDPAKITAFDMIQLGKAYTAKSMSDSANYWFNTAVAKDTAGDKSETYRTIAEGFKTSKDYANSAVWYDKLVKANPNAAAVDYFWRGTMYYYSKDYTNAAKSFEEMEAKYPDQPSATYWRGRVAAATDEEGKTCEGTAFYTKWLEKVGPAYDKKNDLMYAYQYLALCAFNKGDKATQQTYMDKIEAIDPNNSFLKQLKDANKASKAAPAKKS